MPRRSNGSTPNGYDEERVMALYIFARFYIQKDGFMKSRQYTLMAIARKCIIEYEKSAYCVAKYFERYHGIKKRWAYRLIKRAMEDNKNENKA